MRTPIFGRKAASPPPPPSSPRTEHPGHQAVLARLRESDRTDPRVRPRLAGTVMVDFVQRMIGNDRGVRIEDLLAILASTGGFACIVAATHEASTRGQSLQEAGIVVAQGADGQRYLFGDSPNRFLIESAPALLSLTLGAAHQLGGTVSLGMVHECMARVAGSVGGEGFGVPTLPDAHRPGDLPIEYVRHLWPKIVEGLDLYEVPVEARPSALGYALQRAIETGKAVLDPGLAARIAIECAVPMAKLDPARFG